MSRQDHILASAPYAYLVSPTPDHPRFLGEVGKLVKLARESQPSEITDLVCGRNWRYRLVGQSLGAMVKYEAYQSDLLRSLAQPQGWSVFAATAALAVALRQERVQLVEADFAGCNRGDWDGEVGRAIDAAREYIKTGQVSEPRSRGGPEFKVHVAYHEWLWSVDLDELAEISREHSEARWRGQERACPLCSVRFVSVSNFGQCRSCGTQFYASAPRFSAQ